MSWGHFLNYSITWDDAERVLKQLTEDSTVVSTITALLALHQGSCDSLEREPLANMASPGSEGHAAPANSRLTVGHDTRLPQDDQRDRGRAGSVSDPSAES